MVGPIVHRHEELRREHDVVATTLQGLTDDLLRHAAGVDVGGVDEVDPGVEGVVDDADGVGAVVVAPGAEHHRAQAQRADRDTGPSQQSVVHVLLLVVRVARVGSAAGDVVESGEAVEGAGVADERHQHGQHGEQLLAGVADREVSVDVPAYLGVGAA